MAQEGWRVALMGLLVDQVPLVGWRVALMGLWLGQVALVVPSLWVGRVD